MTRLLAGAFFVLVLAFGTSCVVRARTHGTVVASQPDLVAVAPGVHVIADYGEPIFFADGFYWWFYDGYWYRSSMYTDGWVYVTAPPRVVLSIGDPYRYRHYRPHNYVVRHRPAPVHTIRRPVVRERHDTRRQVRDHRR
ncbi:MAG: hypothetical protein F9K40_08645 [Kofleriaceae bacterium]|nr:MAG: hypothetical protein F9K40_08645 [Kofleriaceae bacterium]MBZ0235320.1 hypothetical protein [Kofleriaceae bacterium]